MLASILRQDISTHMMLIMYNRQVRDLHVEVFQLPVSCQCGGMIKIIDALFMFAVKHLARKRLRIIPVLVTCWVVNKDKRCLGDVPYNNDSLFDRFGIN